MAHTDWESYLKDVNQWVNEVEDIINEYPPSDQKNSIHQNISTLREEIGAESVQKEALILQLMDELHQGYEEFRQSFSHRESNNEERMEGSLCHEFASIVHGQGVKQKGICSVDLTRDFRVTIEGKDASSVLAAHLSFEGLDKEGNALNLSEITILEREVFPFTKALLQQELTISALHNHWIYTNPTIFYIHVQSVEPPITFAKKMAKAFSALKSFPVSK